MFPSHIDHIQTHLERVRYGHLVDPEPDSVYLGLETAEHFWELVGLRLEGCPVLVLALLRFQRLDLDGVMYGRESVSTYLSARPIPGSADEAGALTALLPPHDQSIPFYLRRLRSGARVQPVMIDPTRIEVAIDFRLQNPILIPALRAAAGPLQDHCYRTRPGHVIRGRSHEIPVTAPDEPHQFVAISSPEQVTPSGVYPLPTLFVNRSFLAFRAEAPTREDMAAALRKAPFAPAAALSQSLLPLPVPPQLRVGLG